MDLKSQLLTLCSAYAAAARLSDARLSTLLFNDGKKLGQLAAGRDLTVGTLERAMLWLADHWPAGAVWPEGVSRPAVQREAAE